MIITIKAKIHADPKTETVLKDAMLCATKVYNGLLWHLRKEFEEKDSRKGSHYTQSWNRRQDGVKSALLNFPSTC